MMNSLCKKDIKYFIHEKQLLKYGGIMEDTRTRNKLGIVSKAKISLFAVKLVQADL